MALPVDKKRGLYWREEAVSLGSMISQYRLGQSYIDGSFGREPNRDLAIKLIDKSAAQGLKLAITVASNGYPNSEVNMNIELKKSVCKNMKKGFKDLVDYNVRLGKDPYFHLDSYANSIENMECN